MIFKSRQVNLDPEPYVDSLGRRYSIAVGTGATTGIGLRFDPRPEFEPTRDPAPWLDERTGRRFRGAGTLMGSSQKLVWAPRREQFDTPVNRVLAFLREWMVEYGVEGVPSNFMADRGEHLHGATPDEIDHARRVLIRLNNFNLNGANK